jgi:hypothetical protein
MAAWLRLPDRRRIATVAVLATCFTHVFVWLLGTTWPRVLMLEVAIIPVEALCYVVAAGVAARYALFISAVTNVSSFGAGLALFAMLRVLT